MRGASLSKSFANFHEGRLRPADRARAVDLLESVKDVLPSFYFTARTHLLLALIHERLGRPAEAARARRDLATKIRGEYADFAPWLGVIEQAVQRRYVSRAD